MRNLYDCVLIAVLFVLSLVGGAWGACSEYITRTTDGLACRGVICVGLPITCPEVPNAVLLSNNANECRRNDSYGDCRVIENFDVKCYYTLCQNQTELDSVECLHNGNQWLDGSCCDAQCVCERDGHQWNESTQSCVSCNDHVDVPDKCMETWKKGYTTDAEGNPGGGGYWAITTYECYYDSCAMSLNCTEKSSFPAGNLTCDDFQDTSSTNNCVAVIGYQCTIQCGNNLTKNCDCDGSCEHAKTRADCQCPNPFQSSSSASPGSSSSGQNQSSSSGENTDSSSSNESPGSSGSGPGSSGSGGEDWEYDYRGVLSQIESNTRSTATNTNIAAGYLSNIDRWQSTLNMSIQQTKNSVDAAAGKAAEAAEATSEVKDTLHRTNELLQGISDRMGDTTDVDFSGVSGWVDSVTHTVDSLRQKVANGPDSLSVDSMKSDTSQYKSNYSSLFLSNSTTRIGCYEFKLKKPVGNSKFAQKMMDIQVNFGNLGGMFDMCSIGRGVVRCCGAILVILIMIVSYKAAFKGGE